MLKNYLSNEQMLLNYGSLFTNLTKSTELASEVASYGYDSQKISEGKALLDLANKEYLKNKDATSEEAKSYVSYQQNLKELKTIYASDKKKARVIFKNQPDILKKLGLIGSTPRNIANLLANIRDLYINLQNDSHLREELTRIKFTEENISTQLQKITEVEQCFAIYQKERGESLQATKLKDKAFSNLDKWVKEFYQFMKVALEKKPDLLGIIIKSIRN